MAVNASVIMRSLNSKARLLMDQFRKALDVRTARSSTAEFVETYLQTLQACILSPSPWLGEDLNMPPTDGLVDLPEADLQLADFEQCNAEMWASFLGNLEVSFPETGRLENIPMGM
jgi:hypothetical protein